MSGDPVPKTFAAKKPRKGGRARPDEPLADWCEVAVSGVCEGRATNRHHILLRKHGGGDEKANTLDVCGTGTTGCHGHIHANVAWAQRMGYLIRSGGLVRQEREIPGAFWKKTTG
jgi:hypothetical protein